MRLLHIKISGFKSFVDPITISFPERMSGVVGPNGSGKSNIIDAIRWVVGESSARNLRGETLDDVIFNGSQQRNPAGRASVELVFDNSEGRAAGMWEKYSEISVRRQLARNGVSEYYINGTRTNRRDITQLFLGTGFGARSYSIIEQGMISRIVEAKPVELGAYIEEVSGISKFRDRRKETMSRLRTTRENLDRLDDTRAEIMQRLRHLKYQAEQANRFRKLRQTETDLRFQLMMGEWLDFRDEISNSESACRALDVEREKRTAAVRRSEAQLTEAREKHLELVENKNRIEFERYDIQSEIGTIQRRKSDILENRARAEQELTRKKQERSQLRASLKSLQEQFDAAEVDLKKLDGQLQAATRQMSDQQAVVAYWEEEYDKAHANNARIQESVLERVRQCEAARTSLHAAETRSTDIANAISSLREELKDHVPTNGSAASGKVKRKIAALQAGSDELQKQHDSISEELAGARTRRDRLMDELDNLRRDAQNAGVWLNDLRRSISSANGAASKQIDSWLASHGIKDAITLSATIKVTNGWERAVDRVLGEKLTAKMVDDTQALAAVSNGALPASIYLMDGTPVESKRNPALSSLTDELESSELAMDGLLHGVYTASSVDEAVQLRPMLNAGECLITEEGAMLGPNWYSPAVAKSESLGVLETTRQIQELEKIVDANENCVRAKGQEIESCRTFISQQEQISDEVRTNQARTAAELNTLQDEFNVLVAEETVDAERRKFAQTRLWQLEDEQSQLVKEIDRLTAELERNEATLAQQRERMQKRDNRFQELQKQLKQHRLQLQNLTERRHKIDIEAVNQESRRDAASASIADLNVRIRGTDQEIEEKEAAISANPEPALALEEQLRKLILADQNYEQKVMAARMKVERAESQQGDIDQQRLRDQLEARAIEERLTQNRVELANLQARSESLYQRMVSMGRIPEEEMKGFDRDFDVEAITMKARKLKRKIETAGPVNLTAIEEYNSESERKEYLDSQHADLLRACETLEKSIAKIDRESRQRYMETFEVVNRNFRELFPKIFGGGSGFLEVQGEFPENAGVRIYAKPKGKQINHIQSLSGGEKALTAVVLLLAFFQLNPSPICFLDEVDAPLDDENVIRLCENLRILSTQTQLVLITHNKITMEAVDSLIGVTMPEPNVSKFLSVNLQTAQKYAA